MRNADPDNQTEKVVGRVVWLTKIQKSPGSFGGVLYTYVTVELESLGALRGEKGTSHEGRALRCVSDKRN